MKMKTLTVSAPSRKYEVHIGPGAINLLPDAVGERTAALVADTNTAKLFSQRALALLRDRRAFLCELPAGEERKTLEAVEMLCRDFVNGGLLRRDCVAALGGGVVGDTAGFAAACYMRGARLIQVPTTLIAMTDSSVGGKTGVNLPEGKNLIGAFYQPERVLIDTDFLKTLPEREMRAGLAEVVKYYALGERGIAPLLRDGGIVPGGEAELIYLCCRAKAELVAQDELDTGARMTLNFGHTFGHAIEKRYNYVRYNHGEAVAIGMRLALETGVKLGITPPETASEIADAADRAGLDTALGAPPRELVMHMTADKKRSGGKISLVLLRGIGEPVIYDISAEELEAAL
ncbi:MAG: 3-dehydroquinate synthase [Oscillospiraceae bacterium]|jgi:3-dehydroquinate synthase|nr:3-dehydroquinate synthase [Oscillospiraceae bacterium]